MAAPGAREFGVTHREWDQVRRLFAKAKGLEGSEQSAYLEKACRNESLRREVKSLLAHDKAESLLGIYSSVGSTVLGHYEVHERIGEGGMSLVYRARDTRLKRWVAIKALQPWAMADSGSRERLAQEARSASALNHPNIVTVHEIAEENGVHFIVMEYIAGKTLNRCVPPGGLPVENAVRYAMQITDALAAAHSEGVVHGDIKPLNIMITDRGTLKLLIFGLGLRPWPSGIIEPVKPKRNPRDSGTKVYHGARIT